MYPVKYKQAESGTVRLSLRDNPSENKKMVITLTAKVWWVRL